MRSHTSIFYEDTPVVNNVDRMRNFAMSLFSDKHTFVA
jgi:hypothetical protein